MLRKKFEIFTNAQGLYQIIGKFSWRRRIRDSRNLKHTFEPSIKHYIFLTWGAPWRLPWTGCWRSCRWRCWASCWPPAGSCSPKTSPAKEVIQVTFFGLITFIYFEISYQIVCIWDSKQPPLLLSNVLRANYPPLVADIIYGWSSSERMNDSARLRLFSFFSFRRRRMALFPKFGGSKWLQRNFCRN